MWSENSLTLDHHPRVAPLVLPKLHTPTGLLFPTLSYERVSAEEAVQLLHVADGIVRLVERFEPWHFGLEEAREHFARRRDHQFFASLPPAVRCPCFPPRV